MLKTEVKNAAETISKFLDERECGETFWIDDEGREHTADIGYVSEFLDDLLSYANGECDNCRAIHVAKRIFNYAVSYRLLGDSHISEILCTTWKEKKNGMDELVLTYNNKEIVPHILLQKTAWAQVVDLSTNRVVFVYDGA